MTEDWAADLGNMAHVAMGELEGAMDANGLVHGDLFITQDGRVSVPFADTRDAELFLSLGVPMVVELGSLYDRATAACLGTTILVGEEATEEVVHDHIASAWQWFVHPHMSARRCGWHISADIPVADALTVAANLNAVKP